MLFFCFCVLFCVQNSFVYCCCCSHLSQFSLPLLVLASTLRYMYILCIYIHSISFLIIITTISFLSMSNYGLNPRYPYHRCFFFFIHALASSTADCRVKREKRSTGGWRQTTSAGTATILGLPSEARTSYY